VLPPLLIPLYPATRTVTCALQPETSGRSGASSSFSRTGTRCVTFTQLPVAFCGGSIEKDAPVP
jgi:hypothetical protein